MNAIKTGGAIALGIAVFLGLIFLAVFFIKGAAYVSVVALPYLDIAAAIGFVICILIFLPLSIFRVTRAVACVGLFIASYIFGIELWMYGFIVTYALWGGVGIFLGLCFGGVGVVPLGLIAATLHGEWYPVAQILFGLVTTFGARGFAAYLAKKVDEAQSSSRLAVSA
jgi:hypothetical protein